MKKRLLLGMLATGVIACTGSAKVTSDLEGRTFDFKTVYAWIDATRYETEGAKSVRKERERKLLNLRFSGASFDPEQDQDFAGLDEIFEWARDENLNGSLFLEISNGDKAGPGTTAMYPPPDDAKEDSIIISDYDVSFQEEEVKADDEYPAERSFFGSKRTITVKFDEVGKEAGEVISGTVEIKYEKDEDDADGVKTGTITVEFTAPIINEMIAEKNGSGFSL